MRKLLIILMVLCLPSVGWAAAITSAQTGNWDEGTTWVGGVVPTPGTDTVVIDASYTVTVNTDTTVGTSGANNTVAITVNTGGTLLIPAALTLRGDLVQQRSSTVTGQAGGSLIFDAPSGGQYKWVIGLLAGTAGNAYANIAGTGWGAGQFFTVTSDNARGGLNGWIDGGIGNSRNWVNMDFAYAKFDKVGTASVKAVDYYPSTTGLKFLMNHVLVTNSGVISTSTLGADTNLNWQNIDFRSPLGAVFSIGASADKTTGTRSLSNITIYNGGAAQTYTVYAPDVTISDLYTYGVTTNTSSATRRLSITRLFAADDITTTGHTMVSHQRETSSTTSDSIFLTHYPNPHAIGEGTSATSLSTSNVYTGNIFDGDGTRTTDAGDCVLPNGMATIKGNIAINKFGVLVTGLLNACKATIINNTVYGVGTDDAGYGYLMNINESGTASTQLVSAKNNLIVDAPMGLSQRSGFVAQTVGDVDYNASYNMTTAANIDYPAGHPYAGENSYLGAETYASWWNPSKVFGTDNATHDIVANPTFTNAAFTVRGFFGAATVQDVGKEIVTVNGFAFDGTSATPTTKTVAAVLQAGKQAFTPTNALLKTSIPDVGGGAFIGAVMPASIGNINIWGIGFGI